MNNLTIFKISVLLTLPGFVTNNLKWIWKWRKQFISKYAIKTTRTSCSGKCYHGVEMVRYGALCVSVDYNDPSVVLFIGANTSSFTYWVTKVWCSLSWCRNQNWKTNVSDFVYYSQLGDLRVEREEMEEMLYREEGGAMIEQYQYESNYPGLVVGVSWALGEYDRSLVSLGCLTINISSVSWHSLHPLPCLVM